MSKVIQCDRCKSVYEEPTSGKYILRKSEAYEKYIDLCPKCVEELEKWFDEGLEGCHTEN